MFGATESLAIALYQLLLTHVIKNLSSRNHDRRIYSLGRLTAQKLVIASIKTVFDRTRLNDPYQKNRILYGFRHQMFSIDQSFYIPFVCDEHHRLGFQHTLSLRC